MTFSPPPKQNTAVLIQQGFGDFSRLLDETEGHHRFYAAAHGMDYWPVRARFPDPPADARHANWDCLALLRTALALGYEHVFCLDADAAVFDTGFDLRDALPPGAVLGMCLEDRSPALDDRGLPMYNAGVLYVHNIQGQATDFFDRVWASWPHANGFREQGAINLLMETLGDAFVRLDPRFGHCPWLFEHGGPPVVLAYHGIPLGERCAALRQVVRALNRPHRQGPPLLSVQIVVHDGFENILACLLSVLANTEDVCEVALWDNASRPDTAALLQTFAALAPSVRVTRSERNLGFGVPHNRMAASATCPVLCFLNSDTRVGAGWEQRPLELLHEDAALGAVGPITERWHNCNYLQGSCLLMRAETARRMGPFDTNTFPGAYCEDSDLGARLTVQGYRLACLPDLPVTHLHDSRTSRQVNAAFHASLTAGVPPGEDAPLDVVGLLTANQQVFEVRWQSPPRPAEFVFRRENGIGDVLCCTPSVRRFRLAHPHARIVFETNCPAALAHNPDIDEVRAIAKSRPADMDWDLAECAPPLPGASGHLIDLMASVAGLELTGDERRPVLRLTPGEQAWATAHLPARYIAVCTHTAWRVRDWNDWLTLLPLLTQAAGMPVVLLGGGGSPHLLPLGPAVPWRPDQGLPIFGREREEAHLRGMVEDGQVCDFRGRTRLRQAFAAIAGAALFVGPDSGLAHAAGALSVPSVVLGGAILPERRVHAGQTPLRSDIGCIGCYHRGLPPRHAQPFGCRREHQGLSEPSQRHTRTVLCMSAISAQTVLAACLERLGEQ